MEEDVREELETIKKRIEGEIFELRDILDRLEEILKEEEYGLRR